MQGSKMTMSYMGCEVWSTANAVGQMYLLGHDICVQSGIPGRWAGFFGVISLWHHKKKKSLAGPCLARARCVKQEQDMSA